MNSQPGQKEICGFKDCDVDISGMKRTGYTKRKYCSNKCANLARKQSSWKARLTGDDYDFGKPRYDEGRSWDGKQ